MIEYLLVLARKQIRCPLPDCSFLFVSKLNSPLIICSYAVVLCIALEDHLQIRVVESAREEENRLERSGLCRRRKAMLPIETVSLHTLF